MNELVDQTTKTIEELITKANLKLKYIVCPFDVSVFKKSDFQAAFTKKMKTALIWTKETSLD